MPWENDPFEKGEGAQAVMKMMGVTARQGEVMVVTLKLLELTAESKVQAGAYQNVRVYQRFDGNGLQVHIPVYDPAHDIDDATGNAGVLARVHRVLARQLDGVAVSIANERLDQQIAAADEKAATKGGVKIGQPPRQQEVL